MTHHTINCKNTCIICRIEKITRIIFTRTVTGTRCGKTCHQCQAQENMSPMQSAGKHATNAKREKTRHQYHTRENTSPMSNAGKHVTNAKRGKTCHQCQARENMSPMPSAGKPVTNAKRGKTRHQWQVRENTSPMPNAGKHVTNAMREKCHVSYVPICDFSFCSWMDERATASLRCFDVHRVQQKPLKIFKFFYVPLVVYATETQASLVFPTDNDDHTLGTTFGKTKTWA